MKLKEIAQNQMLSSKSKLPCFLQEKKNRYSMCLNYSIFLDDYDN